MRLLLLAIAALMLLGMGHTNTTVPPRNPYADPGPFDMEAERARVLHSFFPGASRAEAERFWIVVLEHG